MTIIIVAIVLILVIVIPVWLLGAGLLYASAKLKAPYFLLLLAGLVLLPYGGYKALEYRWQMQAVPDALHVTSLSYSQEEAWGFGPGGNEAGFRAYPLPDDVAAQITQRGMAFFDKMPPNANQSSRSWRGQYTHWKATPIKPGDDGWTLKDDGSALDVHDYVHKYVCCIEINAKLRQQANAIVNSPGSYYAKGRIGIIVVSPQHSLVLYLYNG